MLLDFIKDALILSCLLMIINFRDLSESLQVKDSILRIETSLLYCPVKGLECQGYRI